MSANISWQANDEADDILQYHVERSIVGVMTSNQEPFNISTTSTLQLRIDGGNLLTITFGAVTNGAATALQVATVIHTAINSYGGSAKVTEDGGVIIQSNRQTDRGSVNIKAGTALGGLGILAGLRNFQSEAVDIAQVAHPTATYLDLDGEEGYQYRIYGETNSGAYSDPTAWFAPFPETIETSIIYGHIISPDGKPMSEIAVQYGPPLEKRPSEDTLNSWIPNRSAHVGIDNQLQTVETDENGYFQMIVPAQVPMRLKIDAIGHDFVYKTPAADTNLGFTQLTQAVAYDSYALDTTWGNLWSSNTTTKI